jgi:hypothetical protein
VLLALEGHGRESIQPDQSPDVSRTVGWFTSVYPFLLEVAGDDPDGPDDPGEQIKRVKESLRAIPRKGMGYGVLRYLTPASGLSARPAVSFNYLGQFGGGTEVSIFRPAREPSGQPMAEQLEREHALDIGAIVVEG